MVRQFSDEPGSVARGGDLGTFKPDVMVPEFAKAVVALKIGERSGIVETRFGFHIIVRTK
jgi:parvulin-like peptidyl-prolyl isomerase